MHEIARQEFPLSNFLITSTLSSKLITLCFLDISAHTATVLDIKRVENAFFHSMYIFSVILRAIDKHDIYT